MSSVSSASSTAPAAPRHRAHADLLQQLVRVARQHDERRANPIVAGALQRLAKWQALRLRNTYADLAAEPRYAKAITFFENDLYGSGDFTQRDADLARVVPIMVRMLPERVIATVAEAVELNALSHDLDTELLMHLPRLDAPITVAHYCAAYRGMDKRDMRERQIRLIGDLGSALDQHVKKPLIRSALLMMRKPAHVAGFGALHDFLERGFAGFRAMHGAELFMRTVLDRETALMQRIFRGDPAPFPDPLGRDR